MNASLEQHIIDLIRLFLSGSNPELTKLINHPEIFGCRVLCWVSDTPLTAEQQESMLAVIPDTMKPAGIAAAAFNEEGTLLQTIICMTTFPARIHGETALWLCAQGLLEYCANELGYSGTVAITDEFQNLAEWETARASLRDLSDWWSTVSPIKIADARIHRAKLQTYIKRRQFTMLGGYTTRILRSEPEINRLCFGFVPLTIEAVWNQHPELGLHQLTEGLNLREMSRKPRESLLNWLGTLPPLLRACPASASSEPVEHVIDSIRANCALPYSQANLSRSLGLTPAYFCRLFHDKAGMHFSTFLTMTRMEKAKELLALEDSLPLQELSLACGYPNKSYFCQVFKKYTGMTPGEYELHIKKERQ